MAAIYLCFMFVHFCVFVFVFVLAHLVFCDVCLVCVCVCAFVFRSIVFRLFRGVFFCVCVLCFVHYFLESAFRSVITVSQVVLSTKSRLYILPKPENDLRRGAVESLNGKVYDLCVFFFVFILVYFCTDTFEARCSLLESLEYIGNT